MDGLLFILLLFWLFKRAKKKKGKQRKKLEAQLRSAVEKALQAMEKARTQAETQPVVEQTQELAEGMSYMQPAEEGQSSGREEYMGSLAVDTMEGKDTCDPTLGHERMERTEDQSVYAEEIGSEPVLDLSAEAFRQGFVMSEILKRPSGYRRFRR